MELDDLKKQWKEVGTTPSPELIRKAIEKKIPGLERSGRSIRINFWIEMIIALLVYAFFVYMMWRFGKIMPLYMYKIVITIGVLTTPIVWRLYKSQRWVNAMDYTVDVRTNVVAFLKYYKRTLWLYEYGTYFVVAITLVILFTDSSFNDLQPKFKWPIVTYVTLLCLVVRPYIRFAYGRKMKVFEDFLKE